MLRGSVFSIVLLLGIGQDTAILCRLWCHPGGTATPECHQPAHSSTPLVVAGDDTCGLAAVSAAVLTREDVRRASGQDVRHALDAPHAPAPALLAEAWHSAVPARAAPPGFRPLVFALRI